MRLFYPEKPKGSILHGYSRTFTSERTYHQSTAWNETRSTKLADRGADAHVDEQPRPGRGRKPGRTYCLRRHWQGGAQLGMFRPHHRDAETLKRRRNSARAIG